MARQQGSWRRNLLSLLLERCIFILATALALSSIAVPAECAYNGGARASRGCMNSKGSFSLPSDVTPGTTVLRHMMVEGLNRVSELNKLKFE